MEEKKMTVEVSQDFLHIMRSLKHLCDAQSELMLVHERVPDEQIRELDEVVTLLNFSLVEHAPKEIFND